MESEMKNEPKASRTKAGQTQVKAAASIGVAKRTWQDWEAGVSSMPPALLKLYRHLAGVERIPFAAVGYQRPDDE